MVRRLQIPAEPVADGEAMEALGRALAQQLGPGDVVALVGPLGAGKTTLVKGLAAGLRIDPEAVTSPTFALAHHYRGGDAILTHLDLYRLKDGQEAEAAGLADLMHDPEAVVAVEWPERALAYIPREACWLQIDMEGSARRVTQVLPPEALRPV